ncbi:hypothetical protein C4568_00230 [Candidatus Parcubacteria bacterium]|nr:MAG: hypothetical protein C4568_00230 [Candidatus Parcubacteria bacterium]
MVDYVYIIENGIVRAYLSEQGKREMHEIGKALLNENFYRRFLSDADSVLNRIKAYDQPRITAATALDEWDRLTQLWVDFWGLYKYTDEWAHLPLEEILRSKLSEDDIASFITHEHLDRSGLNPKIAYALDVLKKTGEKKLALHLEAEKLLHADAAFADFLLEGQKVQKDIFFALRSNEIRGILQGNEIPSQIAKERLAGCSFVRSGKDWIVCTGDDFNKWKTRIDESTPKTITGKSAFKGKVQGRVVKHLSWSSTSPLEKGDILVTGMTNPQMIPFIKNAAAIVTDEGGLTCHAAIISREFKIPCIVGTQGATKLLNNGDMVEVDADRGEVRILQQAEK